MSAKRDRIVRRAKRPLDFDYWPFSQAVKEQFAALSARKPGTYPEPVRSARNRKGGRS